MLPEELKSGDPLKATWLNRLVRAIVARTVNAGPGLLKTQTPAGTTLSLAPQRRTPGAAAESGMWRLSVADGRVTVGAGVWTDAGGAHRSPETDIDAVSSGLVVAALEDGGLSLSVRDASDLPDTPYRVLGAISGGRAEQYESGPLAFDDAADAHWGAIEPLVEISADGAGSWNANKDEDEATAVAESRLVDIDLDPDGKVTGKHYRTTTVDSKGNVVAISERTESTDPDPGEADEDDDEPNCGHPLNESDDDHPFGNGNGDYEISGGGGGGGVDDEHPLDNDGHGGYSPACAEN